MTLLVTIFDADSRLTAGLARVFASALHPGDTLALRGPVGAGKTHFARAFIRARQGEYAEDVPSPTFTLVQTYDDPMGSEIWHADLYRLGDIGELVELGLDDAMAEAITLIEWPEKGGDLPGALTISIEPDPADPDLRQITLTGDPVRWGHVERLAQIARLLRRANWDEARITPLAGDASSRRYLRLVHEADHQPGSAVLMDASPGSCGPYVAMTQWLRARDFHAPEIYATDERDGLLLLEDLGDALVARVLSDQPSLAPQIYRQMTQLLAALHDHSPPDYLLRLDGAELSSQVGLFAEWYPAAVGADGLGQDIAKIIRMLHVKLCEDVQPVLGLRDFHAENLVWQKGAPLGLLDFQDAVITHPAYDLVSGLQDARRDISPQIEEAELAFYIATTGRDPERFRAAYALLGAQRSLRIMGIFTRLCIRDAKPRYLEFMPRVWCMITRNLAHPALAPLAEALEGIPAPSAQIIERIRSQCPKPHAH
ncbi:tRNA (adenosine(37)-N6)-threonylcarbamoyltransferase complex ATPase subunit type 1 TsaE [Paracoccus sp. (in: a-proteobacteria)]|uniref:tRNA (adenosine(37)-N6)-threonylcarbamoyltransferase complex ATPase subunit type 1 TsaE n=1 Tax=Paracoccus sp. TaxID=267 RepID=UPI00289AAA25|nr:tRNA (adenosine(37)-N6)-threonylcarbamoyltransferase complex ATPase subunit type 1 TsaE [Paracoccus sp. (in: a-proteobacteria)]